MRRASFPLEPNCSPPRNTDEPSLPRRPEGFDAADADADELEPLTRVLIPEVLRGTSHIRCSADEAVPLGRPDSVYSYVTRYGVPAAGPRVAAIAARG